MNNTYTLLETLKTSDGNTIIFNGSQISKFYDKTFEENFANLSIEEKEEVFRIDRDYEDLLFKVLREPLQEMMKYLPKNPIDEYEFFLSQSKSEDVTEEQYNLKIERLRQHKEWYEKQTL